MNKNLKCMLIILHLVCFPNFHTLYSYKFPSSIVLEEDRDLELMLMGFNKAWVDQNNVTEELDGLYTSHLPYGNKLCDMTINSIVTFIDEIKTISFVSNLFSKAFFVDGDYFILIDDFQSVFNNFFSGYKYIRYWQIFLINFNFQGSPFGLANVYLNYTLSDIDTHQRSLLRSYSDRGISFTHYKNQIMGLFVSTDPPFPIPYFPLVKDTPSSTLNKQILQIVSNAIRARINPSPTFNYFPHDSITLHISFIDFNNSFITNHHFENLLSHEQFFEDFLVISDVSIDINQVVNVNPISESILEITETTNNFPSWIDQLIDYCKANAQKLWGVEYEITDSTSYSNKQDYFICIFIGSSIELPYSKIIAGLTEFGDDSSEFGGISILTINSDNYLMKNEGITIVTVHEISHLFGLTHPHDYLGNNRYDIEYCYEWSFTSSVLSYQTCSINYDSTDHQLLWRLQYRALLSQLSDVNSLEFFKNKIQDGYISNTNKVLFDLIKKNNPNQFYNSLFFFIIPIAFTLLSVRFYLIKRKNRKE